jgi:hypothetical protein
LVLCHSRSKLPLFALPALTKSLIYYFVEGKISIVEKKPEGRFPADSNFLASSDKGIIDSSNVMVGSTDR